MLAEKDSCSVEEFVDGSLELALFSARAVLNNELGEKYDTGLLIVDGGTLLEAYNLSVILRAQAADGVTLGVEDPFESDAPTPLELDTELLQGVSGICGELGTDLGPFMSTAIDLRCIVTDALRNRQRALVETTDPKEYIDLTAYAVEE